MSAEVIVEVLMLPRVKTTPPMWIDLVLEEEEEPSPQPFPTTSIDCCSWPAKANSTKMWDRLFSDMGSGLGEGSG
jgi:hypothetical protein